MSFLDRLNEHLKTKKKYNTLEMKYEILKNDYETKVVQYDQLKRDFKATREVWVEELQRQEKEIIKLKKRGVKDVSKSTNASVKVSRAKQDNNK